MNNTRTLTFKGNQGAEDLFFCKETESIYVRQPCDNEHVRWLTGSKWAGGYEADCTLKEGLKLRIAGADGQIDFCETIVRKPGYTDTLAEKAAPFSYEFIRSAEEKLRAIRHLATYENWKAWLMAKAEDDCISADAWLYDAAYEEPKKISKLTYLGKTLYLTAQFAKHRKCDAEWICFELRSSDLSTCEDICGYAIEEEK